MFSHKGNRAQIQRSRDTAVYKYNNKDQIFIMAKITIIIMIKYSFFKTELNYFNAELIVAFFFSPKH